MSEEQNLQTGEAQSDQSDKHFGDDNPIMDYAPSHAPLCEEIEQTNAMVSLTYSQLQEIANTIVDLHESIQNPVYWNEFKKRFTKEREKRQEAIHHLSVNCYLSLEAKFKAEKND